MKPKVTIGICTRNSENTISATVDSVVSQDYNHELMEIIFVDGRSKDKTLSVINNILSKSEIHARIFNDQGKGLGAARQIVVNKANGDYIVWLDGDEIFEKGFVRKQIQLMEQNPKAGIVTARLAILPEENLVLALDLLPRAIEYSRKEWKHPWKLPGTGGTTYRIAAAKQVGGFDESMTEACEDIDIAKRINQCGWLVLRGDARFYEKHGNMSEWATLWKRSVSRGIQSRRLHRKASGFFSLYRMNPISSCMASIIYAIDGYRLTKLKIAFLLPFHFTFKMTAWFYGFNKG